MGKIQGVRVRAQREASRMCWTASRADPRRWRLERACASSTCRRRSTQRTGVLGGSWVAISKVISTLNGVISVATRIIPVLTIQEPPSGRVKTHARRNPEAPNPHPCLPRVLGFLACEPKVQGPQWMPDVPAFHVPAGRFAQSCCELQNG